MGKKSSSSNSQASASVAEAQRAEMASRPEILRSPNVIVGGELAQTSPQVGGEVGNSDAMEGMETEDEHLAATRDRLRALFDGSAEDESAGSSVPGSDPGSDPESLQTEEPESAADPTPEWQRAIVEMRQEHAANMREISSMLAEQQKAAFSHIEKLSQAIPQSRPEEESDPEWSPQALLRKAVRDFAGEDASDSDIADLAASLKSTLAMDHFRDHPEWAENKEAQQAIHRYDERFRRAAQEKKESRRLREEIAHLREKISSIEEAPKRAQERESMISLMKRGFDAPQPDHTGYMPKDSYKEAMPVLARVSRELGASGEIAEYAIDTMRQSGADFRPDDQQSQVNFWRTVKAIEDRVTPMLTALEGASAEHRPAVVAAMKSSAVGDEGFGKIIDKLGSALAIAEPKISNPVDETEKKKRSVSPPSIPTRSSPVQEETMVDGDSWWSDTEESVSARWKKYVDRVRREGANN